MNQADIVKLQEEAEDGHIFVDHLISALRGVVAALTDPRRCIHLQHVRAEMIAREAIDGFDPPDPEDVPGHDDTSFIDEPPPLISGPSKLH